MADQNDKEFDDDDTDAVDEPWPDSTTYAFAKASDAACVKCFHLDFDAAVQEYRALEAEFLIRIGDRQNEALEIRRRVAERILDAAHGKKVPFEACTGTWNDLLQLGFSNFERQCTMTWFFADCCRKHRQTEIGLAILEPLITKLERLQADAEAAKMPNEFYQRELEALIRLRAKLQAQRG